MKWSLNGHVHAYSNLHSQLQQVSVAFHCHRASSQDDMIGHEVCLFAACLKYHNRGDCMGLRVLCKLHLSRLQLREFCCKQYLFYGLPISLPDAIKAELYYMAIIVALHQRCIMRRFLMSHKVSSFSARETVFHVTPTVMRWIFGSWTISSNMYNAFFTLKRNCAVVNYQS